MVREILHLQVGQCGNQVGQRFWEAICEEHKISLDKGKWIGDAKSFADEDGDGIPDELENVDVYFSSSDEKDHVTKRRFVPRALIVDLEPGTKDVINQGKLGKLFNQDYFLHGANGAGNNWAKGHYTEGAELIEQVMTTTRKAVEETDCLQGFQLMHSLGGGTGSGMGTLLLLKIRDAYPDKITSTYSIYPSPKVSDTVVEPYNAVLSSHQLLENSDETFIVDNEALYNIAHNVLKKNSPTYSVLNSLIADATCGVTASIRFPGMLNGDLRKLGVNLVPFPRLHFFLISQAPLTAEANQSKSLLNIRELTSQAYSQRNFLSNVKPDDGKYLAVSFVFRGNVTSSDVDESMDELQKKNGDEYVEWIPNNIKSSLVSTAAARHEMTATFVANTTALKGIFQRLATQFGAMYKRKAFLHWYKGEGMDEMEFQEADKNVRDLITEYQDKETAVYEADDDEEQESNSGGY
jgi:tubulin beta